MGLRRYLGRLRGVLVVALALFVSSRDCLLTARGFAPFRDDNDSPRLQSGTQAIITSYQFVCYGNITAWQTYVHPAGMAHQGAYNIAFQVWRPSPTVQESGCYSIVGENMFTSISLGTGGLVSETPEPSNVITVQPGDVVGYFVLSTEGKRDGIQLESQNMDSMWYQTISKLSGELDCPIPVGTETNRILTSFTSAAPVLSVDLYSFQCLTTSTVLPSSSSSLLDSIISTTTSLPTQLSKNLPQTPLTPSPSPSHTSSMSPVLSVSISSSAVSSPALTTSSTALSTGVIASIAAAVGSALLLTLLCTIVLAVAITKIQHKRQRNWTLAEIPSMANK